MSAVHVVAGLHPMHGGPSACVPRLCAALDDGGCDSLIQTINEPGSPRNASTTYYSHDFARIPFLRKLKFSSDLLRGVRTMASRASIVHSHGMWLMPNVYAGWAALEANRPLVISAHGMLASEALLHSWFVKRNFWSIVQRPAYAKAAVWHATSAAEAEAIREFGIRDPIAVIPNGVDIPAPIAQHVPRKATRTLLFLSRIHPHKGLANLIRAWGVVTSQRREWKLVIAGQEHGGHRAELEGLARSIGASQFSFVGPVAGREKDRLYETSDLFVLPSKSENFGLVVAEALAAGVPVIVTKGGPWREVERHGCGWWTDTNPTALAASLLQATALSAAERKSMGERGRAWMSSDFGWASIAGQMMTLYSWILGKNARPDFVG